MTTATTLLGEQPPRAKEPAGPGLRAARPRPSRRSTYDIADAAPSSWDGMQESSVSWSSLIATTVGLDDFGRVWVRVRADVAGTDLCRLVVQLYPATAATGAAIQSYARPLASAQRAVTPDELRAGLEVMLVHWMSGQRTAGDTVLIAWVEPGEPNLEFDGLRAKPAQCAYVGMCRPEQERADLVLQRSAA